MWGAVAVAMLGGWLSGGCGGTLEAENAFSTDFRCSRVQARETLGGRYVVRGCGRRAVYVCLGETCSLQTVTEEDAAPNRELSRRQQSHAQPRPVAQRKIGGSGRTMVIELALDDGALLRLTATPSERADLVQLKLVRTTDAEDPDECSPAWMLNGQVLEMPQAAGARDGRELSHRVLIGSPLIREFAVAEKLSLRVCEERFALDREQVEQVRAFMERFQEEVAWQAKPRAGKSGGMLAPAGGWPEWAVNGEPMTAVQGPALDGSALFKRLKVSVFHLEASLTQGTSQGSAVAIGPNELLTNCHVIRGAQKIILRQNKAQFDAIVLRSDPVSDRCVIGVTGVTLTPVAGVRSSASLEVGEPAYTLGSPFGLQLTLGNGIISGQRDEHDRHFVQTTAPISPGSSGGGLFDARGNLIGITTLVLAGRERLNQSLNFAIPADQFWQP